MMENAPHIKNGMDEEPSITEVIERAEHLQCLYIIGIRLSVPIPADAPWNLSNARGTGMDEVENSPLASVQLVVLLAASKSEAVMDLLTDPGANIAREGIERLLEQQALRGMKILDLGCGKEPVLARIARGMGATVFTVDRPGKKLVVAPEKAATEEAQIEAAHHIELDLTSPDWAQHIIERTGGDFDIVTEAHLRTVRVYLEDEAVLTLLKHGGIRHVADILGFNRQSIVRKP